MRSTGAGKTTIYKTYAQNYPSQETEEGSVVPIIYATIPAAATVKGLIGHVMTLIRKGATLAIEQDLDRLDLSILGVIYDKHLKHDKFFKKTDPFSENKFELEAAYEKDS